MTTEDTQKMETELKDILARLTAESEASKNLAVEIKKLEEETDALEEHVTASEKDIAVFLEEQSNEMDAMLADEQKEMEAA